MEMGFYLVERYLPGASRDDLASAATRIAAVAAQMDAEGIRVRYRGSSFIPDEETCFCEFEAPSIDEVEWANERAQVPYARILHAVRLPVRDKARPQA
jgi:hypothetical protein